MIRVEHKGSFKDTERWFARMKGREHLKAAEPFVQEGVVALKNATPKRSGKTAESWSGGVDQTASGITLHWDNSNTVDGVNVAVLIQYGHGTGTGGYVPPTDFINPALKPVMDKAEEAVMKEVTSK